MDALPIPEYQFDQPLLRVDLSSTPDSNIDGCADMNGSSTHPFPSLPDDPTLPHEKPSTTSLAKVMLRDRLGGGFTWTAYAASMMVSLDDHGQVLPIQSLMVEWDPGYWTEEAGTHDDLSESKAETTSPQVQRRYSLESISGPSTDHHEPTIQRFKTTSLVPENDLAHPLTIPRVSRQIQLQDITAPTNGSPGSTKSTNSSPSTHTTGTGAYSSSPPTSASPNRSAFPHRIHLANPLPQIKIDVCVKVCDPQVRSAEEDGDQDERLFVYNIVSEAELYASGEVMGLEGTVVPLSYGLFARSVDGGQKETVFVSVQQLAGGAVCDKWVDLHPSYK